MSVRDDSEGSNGNLSGDTLCVRCSMVVNEVFYHESGGLCGYCLADDALGLSTFGDSTKGTNT